MDAAMPPVPPGIAAQQGASPLRQFAQGGQGTPSPDGAPQGASSDQLLANYVDEVGKTLTKIAQITGQTHPEFIPILKQAVQAMVMFAGKVKTSQGQQSQPAPDGGSQGTADGTAPDAGGGSAMGMPQ